MKTINTKPLYLDLQYVMPNAISKTGTGTYKGLITSAGLNSTTDWTFVQLKILYTLF
jgi:hypothetical protein